MMLTDQIAAAANAIVKAVKQTDYQHTDHIDEAAGIYDCDCNGFVGYVLRKYAASNYELIPKEPGQPRPRAFKYYEYFASLDGQDSAGWERIDTLKVAAPGDIIAWRAVTIQAGEDTGHVMIVAAVPTVDAAGIYSVIVYDSADKPHFNDTRAAGTSGVGKGAIQFKVDGEGRPIAFLFAPPTTATNEFEYLDIAIGRLKAIRNISMRNDVKNASRLVGYFVHSPIEARNISIADIPADQLTHVIYASAGISSTGECVLIDAKTDSVNLAQLLQLKSQHPALKTLISVGGALLDKNFNIASATAASRQRFAKSCVIFIRKHGLDGIDIHWDHPTARQKRSFTALIAELRRQLDERGKAEKKTYLLTIAGSGSATYYTNVDLALVQKQVDWINLLAFDFTLLSSPVTNLDAPLFPASDDPADPASRLTHNVDAAVKAFLEADVPPQKLTVGVRFGGIGWQGVANINSGLYQINKGAAAGTWDAAGTPATGHFGFQDIETSYLPTYTRTFHPDAKVPWLYNSASGTMISYEDTESIGAKADYVSRNQLGGVAIWDISADDDQRTLLAALAGAVLPAQPFVHLTGANLAATILDNLKTGAAAQAFINTTLNASLRASLVAAATKAGQTLLATLEQAIPSVNIASQKQVNLQEFVKSNITLPTDKTDKKTIEMAIAQLSATTTIGGLLGLNTALQDSPIFAAEVKRVAITALLNTSPAIAAQPQLADDFVRLYAASTTSIQDFWAGLSQNPEFSAVVPDLQLTLQLGTLTQNNTLLVEALQGLRQQGTLKSLQDLVRLDTTAWTNVISTPINGQKITIPAGTAGTTAEDQAANYAAVLQGSLRSMFPTAALAQDLSTQPSIAPSLINQLLAANPGLNLNQDLPLNLNLAGIAEADQAAAIASLRALQQESRIFPGFDYQSALATGSGKSAAALSNPIRADVALFLANSAHFDFQTTNIDAYITAHPTAMQGVSDQPQAVRQLKAIQRIYRVAPDYGTMSALMGQGLNSAYGIATMPSGGFVRRYSGVLGGPEAAQRLYSKAQHITAQSSTIYMRKFDESRGVNFGSIKTNGSGLLPGSQPQTLGNDGADWQTLFGNTTACQCCECRAVDGPAAYFVDLLQFLGNGTPSVTSILNLGGYTPLDVLIGYNNNAAHNPNFLSKGVPPGRRPDLAYLKLNCVNTETELPYVDLVNEILESYIYYVCMQQNSALPPSSNNTPSDATSDELSVNPEYTVLPVYDSTGPLATSVYPFALPYDRFLAITRVYLAFTTSSLYELMKTFAPFGPPSLTPQATAFEYLNISTNELLILTGQPFAGTSPQTNDSDLGQYYGYPSTFGSDIASIQPAPLGASRWTNNESDSDMVTITTLSPHGFIVGQVVTISDAADPTFDGTFVISEVPSLTTFVYNQAGAIATSGAGTVTTSWPVDLSTVANFLQQTGISFQDLTSLLFTRFLNPSQTITLQPDPDDACNINTMMIANLAPTSKIRRRKGIGSLVTTYYTTLRLIYRFIRLYTKLGWQIPELDKTLTAFNSTDIDAPFIWAAAQLNQLKSILNLSVVQLLGLWTDIDTDGRSSLYNSLFQNKAVINPVDQAFQLTYFATLAAGAYPTAAAAVPPPQMSYDQATQLLSFTGAMTDDQYQDLLAWAGSSLGASLAVQNLYNQRWHPGTEVVNTQALLSAHINTILSALQISADDVTAIATDAGLISPSGNWSAVTIANLSVLYRYAVLAQALSLSVTDFISLKTLTGLNPFKLSASTTAPITDNAVQFVQAVQDVNASAFSPAQLCYLFRAISDAAETLPPLQADQDQLLIGLSTGLQKIANANAFTADPSGTALRKKLGSLLNSPQVGLTIGLIDGTAIYSSPLVNMPTGVTPPAGQVSFVTNATIGGTITPGDVVTLSLAMGGSAAPVSLSYPVGNTVVVDTLISIASGLTALINTNQTLRNVNISATAAGAVITLPTQASAIAYPIWSGSVTGSGTETVSFAYALECLGPMSDSTRSVLAPQNATPGPFINAVTDLYNQAQNTLTQNLNFLAPATAYIATLAALPVGIALPLVPPGQVSYSTGNLICDGAMTNPTRSQLLALSNDASFTQAVNLLYSQAWGNAIGQLIDFPAASLPSVSSRYNYVLESLLTFLTISQSQNLVKQSLGGAVGLNATMVALLLQGNPTTGTPSLLPSQSLPPQLPKIPPPAIVDMLGGLLGVYTPSLPGATPVTQIDPGIDLDGAETAFAGVQWFGRIVPPATDTYTFYTPTGDGAPVQLWVDGQKLAGTPVPPATQPVVPQIALQAGQIYDIQLNYTPAVPGQATIQLQWSNSTTSRQIVPPAAFVLGAAPSSAQGMGGTTSTVVQGGAYSTLSLLYRIAVLVNGFSMKTNEVEYLSVHADDFPGHDSGINNTVLFNLANLPLDYYPTPTSFVAVNPNQAAIDHNAPAFFNLWHRLNSIYTLKSSLPSGNVGLFDIFRTASSGFDPTASIIAATGWSPADLAALLPNGAGFANETVLVQLAATMKLVSKLGVPAQQLLGWASGASSPSAAEAQDIQNTIKAKYNDATWLQVGKPLNDKVRESSKESLIAYILGSPPIVQSGITDADGLYEYFLIDVQMCTCMQTSRIVQGTAAVQLFVERCLMGLENGNLYPSFDVAPCQIDGVEWETWRKNYRVWQANREVFLYPEDYVEPTLRDNKTSFFKDLENDLMQGEINAANVEQAYLNYLQKLDEVARLEIAGFCLDPSPAPNTNKVYFVGRTAASPAIYYYRSLSQTRSDSTVPWTNNWTPWERVDVDIQGKQLIPVLWNNRLYIFWPMYTETIDSSANQPSTNQSTPGGPPVKSLQIRMAWSEYKQGRWTKKQLSSSTLVPANFSAYQYAQQPFNQPTLTGSMIFFSTVKVDGQFEVGFNVWDKFTDYFYFSSNVDTFGNLTLSAYVTFYMFTPTAPNSGSPFKNAPHNVPNYTGIGAFIFTGYSDTVSSPDPMPEANPAVSLPVVEFTPDGKSPSTATNMVFEGSDTLVIKPTNGTGSADYVPILDAGLFDPWSLQFATPALADLFPPTGSPPSTWGPPFFFWDSQRSYYTSEVKVVTLSDISKIKPQSSSSELIDEYVIPDVSSSTRSVVNATASGTFLSVRLENATQFYTFYHPHVRAFIKAVNVAGLDGLLQLQNQRLSDMILHAYTNNGDVRDTWVRKGYHDDGTPFSVFAPNLPGPTGTQLMSELMNPASVHVNSFLSVNSSEQGPLLAQGYQKSPFGYVYSRESTSHPAGATPLYRLVAGGHFFYTIDPLQRDDAIDLYDYALDPNLVSSDGTVDGILCYAIDPNSILAQSAGVIPACQASPPDFQYLYKPDPENVALPYPKADVDFNSDGAYSVYNWELFFHIPFLIATQLSQNQQYLDADKWFKYIVDFTSDNGGQAPNRYWNFLPFNEANEPVDLNTLLENLDDKSSVGYRELVNQVNQYEENPFDPDAIARLRPSAYQKAVVMKYLDNLIAWGDSLYGLNTRESIAESTQIYMRAKHVVRFKPVTIPQTGTTTDYTYHQLQSKVLDALSNVNVIIENLFPFSPGAGGSTTATGAGVNSSVVANAFYFCVPPDDTLLGYWDTIEDRLYKIRHCMNIQGQFQQLALFAPPINPALLVAAEAAGVDLSSVLNDINGAVPHYRFSYTLQKALELCSDVRSLGGALLSALEKKDAEALSLLRANQELALLNAVLQLKQLQMQEANTNAQALNDTLAVTTARQAYYQGLVSGGRSAQETGQIAALATSQVYKTLGQAIQMTAPTAHLFPSTAAGDAGISGPVALVFYGGENIGNSAEAAAGSFGLYADIYAFLATMASLNGQWDRRSDEWNFQLQTAGLEITQINDQIAAANFRSQIAQTDSDNQQLQIDNAADVLDFLQNRKYTNEDLYSWMIDQVSAVYFQCYQMAYDLAKRAEACFQFELGVANSNYIQFGYWDSLKHGLLCGEKLYTDLKRLDAAYMDQNKREYEIARSISLVLLDPYALITLKQTGQCIVTLPEAFFDLDYPGHYMRRIRNMSLTIPCVTGPYTSVNCTLTLVQSKIRWDSNASVSYPEKPVASDPRFFYDFAATQSIATSTAQNDSGLFEVNFRDERYLPFEGSGLISTWRIDMPLDCNAFDFDTVTDVVINLRYTARYGGDILRDLARKAAVIPAHSVQSYSGSSTPLPNQSNLQRLFSLRHEFPSEWYKFLHPVDTATVQSMSIALGNERFPFQYRNRKITISLAEVILVFTTPTFQASYQSGSLSLQIGPPNPGNPTTITTPSTITLNSSASLFGGAGYGSVASPAKPAPSAPGAPPSWLLQAPAVNAGGTAYLTPDAIDDIFLLCTFSAK